MNVDAELKENLQITTSWASEDQSKLHTQLVGSPVRELRGNEVLAEMLYVPMHGSFWLASHPDAIHPRKEEFMAHGGFVFGNGGLGRIVKVGGDQQGAPRVGDYVAVMGHVPCDDYSCYACNVLHRYTECDTGSATILGHGKGASDGTYARYCILPRMSYEICYRAEDEPTEEDLKPFMFAFLMADVRNALTRHHDTLRNRRMLLFGAGHSGHIAAYLHNRTCPESRIVAVDPCPDRLKTIASLSDGSIDTYQISEDALASADVDPFDLRDHPAILSAIDDIAEKTAEHFRSGRKCNLLFDASSGNTTPLWDNNTILSPSVHCIPFGFGSHSIMLSKDIIQLSGLMLLMSRGVGNTRNRREVIELIKSGAHRFIDQYLIGDARHIPSLEAAEEFIQHQHASDEPMHAIPHAYITPNPL